MRANKGRTDHKQGDRWGEHVHGVPFLLPEVGLAFMAEPS
jgi:hypothetical protein